MLLYVVNAIATTGLVQLNGDGTSTYYGPSYSTYPLRRRLRKK